MDLQKFNKLISLKKKPWQEPNEWKIFLEFCYGYFKQRGIQKPVVIELGIANNHQKQFYEELINAEHIGVDISAKRMPDIVGNTHVNETVEALKMRLAGRMIDLLFIDAGHQYKDVTMDFNLYAPLTRHLIAFHDICHMRAGVEVKRFWSEIKNKRNNYIKIAFNTVPNYMGIGVLIPGKTYVEKTTCE